MPDLHGWTTQQIDATAARADRWHDTECAVHGTTLIDATVLHAATLCDCGGPAVVLRRCAADRKILAEHKPYAGHWSDYYACEGCGWNGADYCPEFMTGHVNDCPTLLALAEGYGLTEEQRAALDRPEKERPERPAEPSLVPPAIVEAYSKALTEMVVNARLVEPRLHVKKLPGAPIPDWLREDLGLPVPEPEPTPEVKAMEILDPELKKIPGYVPTSKEQP